ncbi:MAG: XkdF-like putative serine protease domain-containing protein [Bradyrhizobium sp.]|uniref:XkdF-like putative serine protease domain-containing protein n=1 Tax=Bradyrhizobium sp. TaxID=376 RepID=UPI003D0EA730
MERWERTVEIAKVDDAQNLVFGWLSRVVEKDGSPVVDSQGDEIPAAELEKAAYAHVVEFRKSDVMHNQHATGVLVESFFSTPEKRAAMGVAGDDKSVGWWVGYRVAPETFAKVKAGEYRAFSIGGKARREPA